MSSVRRSVKIRALVIAAVTGATLVTSALATADNAASAGNSLTVRAHGNSLVQTDGNSLSVRADGNSF